MANPGPEPSTVLTTFYLIEGMMKCLQLILVNCLHEGAVIPSNILHRFRSTVSSSMSSVDSLNKEQSLN